jgi:GNAT superfamily N-acetyltransferase
MNLSAHHYTVGKASCTLTPVSDVNCLQISHLYVAPEDRKKGQAKALMAQLCREADAAHFALMLNPQAFGDFDMDDKALTDWYIKLGYSKIQDSPELYCRFPELQFKRNVPKKEATSIIMPSGRFTSA